MKEANVAPWTGSYRAYLIVQNFLQPSIKLYHEAWLNTLGHLSVRSLYCRMILLFPSTR